MGTEAVSNLRLDIASTYLRPCWLVLVGICCVSGLVSCHHVTGTTWLTTSRIVDGAQCEARV